MVVRRSRRARREQRRRANRRLTFTVLGFLAVIYVAAHWDRIKEMTTHG
jgi:hypothetical protein